MAIPIYLSENSRQHIDKLNLNEVPIELRHTLSALQNTQAGSIITIHQLTCIINIKTDAINNRTIRLSISALQASLIQDIASSLDYYQAKPISIHPQNNLKALAKYIGVTIAGVIFVACEGFDAVATIMQLIHLPISMIVGVSCIIAFAAVLIFASFETNEIAKQLGIKRQETMPIIKIQLKQVMALKRAMTAILAYSNQVDSKQECMELMELLLLLKQQKSILTESASKIHKGMSSKRSKIIHVLTTTLEGFVFFSASFCASQTVSSVFATFIVGASISLINPYILATCLAVAFITLGFYIFTNRLSLNKMVNKKFGIDKKKTQKLVSETCDKNNELDILIDKTEFALDNQNKSISKHNEDEKTILELRQKQQELQASSLLIEQQHIFNSGITHFSTSSPKNTAQIPIATQYATTSP